MQESSKKSEDRNDWVVGSWDDPNTVLRFQCGALLSQPRDPPAHHFHMTYKVIQAEMKLVTKILNAHGLTEVPQDAPDFNLLWTGIAPKPETYTTFTAFQRINHFPRSNELTRKDRLSKNIGRYQRSKWAKMFQFMPQSFVLPIDYRQLCAAHKHCRGPWIIKPIASSRGRGINIVNHLNEIPTNENVVVAKYIDNPLLVDGRKCDVRLYVAVTSYNPLVVYIYEEGLVRFATVKYQPGGQQLWNLCMHLCNYSLNKFHSDYVKSPAEDVGHKWTLSALLQHLRTGGSDTAALMEAVEELIVKSLLTVAPPITSAVNMFVPHKRNCFEVYGFDVLIDDKLKPWLLEVNYSPSLGCDTSLDTRVKSAMMVDLLTLTGLPAVDPTLRLRKTERRLFVGRAHSLDASRGKIPATGIPRSGPTRTTSTSEDVTIAKSVRAELKRCGGFVCIFPAQDSWQRYVSLLDPKTGFIRTGPEMRNQQPFPTPLVSHNYNQALHEALFAHAQVTTSGLADRLNRYERVLINKHNLSIAYRIINPPIKKSSGVRDYWSDVIQSLHDGRRLNQWQARRMFAQYLGYVLHRVTGKSKVRGQAEHVIKFLQRVSVNLRTPYTIQMPSPRLTGKDREAVVAKRLYDFLSAYSHETDVYAVKDDRPHFVNDLTYRAFIQQATEKDLDEVLSLHTRLYKCAHQYLGRCGVNGSGGQKPIPCNVQTPALSSILLKKTRAKIDV